MSQFLVVVLNVLIGILAGIGLSFLIWLIFDPFK